MVTFRDYMESALYSAGGDYEHRTPTEDFYTAPELHPAFAGILAAEAVARLKQLAACRVPGPYHIIEMGSGPGTLGSQVLRHLRERHGEWAARIRYIYVERSETQLLGSIVAADPADHVLGYSRLEDVPPCAGVFLSNELVDAFPVHLLEKQGGLMKEVYVQTAGPKAEGIRGGEGVRAALGDLSCPELRAVAQAVAPQLPEGARHAVNLEAGKWMAKVAQTLTAGTVLTVDYGKRFGARPAPNPARTYFKHSVDNLVMARPGRQDLTASVDFDTLIEAGERCGLRMESYNTLSRFLIDRGIMDWMPADGDGLSSYKERLRLKTLLHPEGMGEAYKVLIQEKVS